MNLHLVAIFHHYSQKLPVVMELTTQEKFFESCKSLPTDWAHLYNKHTGELIQSFYNK
jgi:hypothetical protein